MWLPEVVQLRERVLLIADIAVFMAEEGQAQRLARQSPLMPSERVRLFVWAMLYASFLDAGEDHRSVLIESIEVLLPALPGPMVFVLDNATAHRSKWV